ncbi:hypothetical protein FRC10_003357 [Ceratobasidium sp. 414]|nr:hypothetical protein FRC10_003357 [Ceratobasidium sp. 414]
MGEIDDIFAGKVKSKGKAKEVEDPVPKAPLPSKKKKKKSKKVEAEEPPAAPAVVPVVGTKRKLPETVVDPSLAAEPKAKKSKEGRKAKATTGAENSDDERFRDSRGTGPRRRTEEGYAIYKEDELGIGTEGGDTPLCPFDCDCCELLNKFVCALVVPYLIPKFIVKLPYLRLPPKSNEVYIMHPQTSTSCIFDFFGPPLSSRHSGN